MRRCPDPNGAAELASPLAVPVEEATRHVFAIELNNQGTGGGSNDLAEVPARFDVRVRQDYALPGIERLILI